MDQEQAPQSKDASASSRCSRLPPNSCLMVQLTAGFSCVLTAFISQQNLMPSVLAAAGAGDLGLYSLAVVYSAFTVSCLVAPDLLSRRCPRKVIPLGTFPYALFAASGALAAAAVDWAITVKLLAFAALLLASAGVGFGAGFVWIGQGHVVNHSAPRSLLNNYTSFFFANMHTTTVVGALLAEQILTHMSKVALFVVLAVVSFSGTLVMVRLQKPTPRHDIPPEPLLQKNLADSGDSEATVARTSIFSRFVRPLSLVRCCARARRIALLACFLGISLNCFVAGVLPQFVTARVGGLESDTSPALVAAANVCLTIGMSVGCGMVGLIADCIGRRNAMLLMWVVFLGCAVMCLLEDSTTPYLLDFLPFTHLAALCLGWANGAMQSWQTSLIAANYGEGVKDAVALQFLCCSIASVIVFVAMPQLSAVALLASWVGLVTIAVLWACTSAALFKDNADGKEVEEAGCHSKDDSIEPAPASHIDGHCKDQQTPASESAHDRFEETGTVVAL